MKALLIVGLVIIGNSNACADFSLEAKCLKDERTGIIITYNDSGELFYWRARYILAVSKGEKKYVTQCFVSAKSPMEKLNIPRIGCDKAKNNLIDIYNSN